MAKKNSSKTATEKAISSSEPKVQTFTGWQGVNFKDSPLGWDYAEGRNWGPWTNPSFGSGRLDAFHQQDLKTNYLLIQNNLVTTDGLTVETRPDSIVLGENYIDNGNVWTFTGVACLYRNILVCAVERNGQTRIVTKELDNEDLSDWEEIAIRGGGLNLPDGYSATEIGYYEQKLIIMAERRVTSSLAGHDYEWQPKMFVSNITVVEGENREEGVDQITFGAIYYAQRIPDPTGHPNVAAKGIVISANQPASGSTLHTRYTFCYAYSNMFGCTAPSGNTVIYADYAPEAMTTDHYLELSGTIPAIVQYDIPVEGVDIYVAVDDAEEKIFAGHTVPDPESGKWSFKWLGAMSDVSQWTNVPLKPDGENTTEGVRATHFANIDSRLYFWGDRSSPYRLYVGGNPGHELSVARGLGGAWVDIEPGSGIEVHGVAKWKTVSGANIVTIMCGNPNTNRVKRFNLVETNTTVTNELNASGYMYEEVSNVVGCNSRWGFGVFSDGLYSFARYGLMLTTMAMEYNAQMRNQSVSEVVQPIFTDRVGNRLNDARMVCIDDIIYIVLSEEEDHDDEPQSLDRVILCYDMGVKAWYTFTHDGDDSLLLHAMPIDSEDYPEGLGVITENEVRLYPTTGIQDTIAPDFDVLLETGEISARQPKRDSHWLEQLELRFDYFIGTCNVVVEGVDYYGRYFRVDKVLNREGLTGDQRDWTEWIRIGRLVESYRITLKGPARFRLVAINAKAYTYSNRIGMVYGYDAAHRHTLRDGGQAFTHHYIDSYNNLRRAIVV